MSDGIQVAITAALEHHGVGLRQAMAIYAIVERRYTDARDWLDSMNGAAKPTVKKSLSVAKPKRGGANGTRVCEGCQQSKGVTAFKAGGGTLCIVCRRARGRDTDKGIKIVRCTRCGKGYPSSQVNGDGICQHCLGG